jgi:hypothetical protein
MVHLLIGLRRRRDHKKNPVQTAGFGGIDLDEKSSARVDLRSPERELFSTMLRYTNL